MLCVKTDDIKKQTINSLGFRLRSPLLISILIYNLWNGVYLSFWTFQLLAILCCVLPPYINLFMLKSPSPFIKIRVFLFYSFPSLQILPVKKHRRQNEKQKRRRAKSLRGEGPIKRAPFPSKECAQRWREMKEVKGKKKNCSLYFLKIDFFFYSERKANREAGWGLDWRRERIEGGGQVVSNTKADERGLLAE